MENVRRDYTLAHRWPAVTYWREFQYEGPRWRGRVVVTATSNKQ